MGYLIESGFIVKTITIAEADFQTCGTIPFLLLSGKPNMVFQFFSIMASNGSGYSSASPYTIISSITNFEVAATHYDNFNSSSQPCNYNIGVNLTTDNSQKAGNDLYISIRSGIDPTGTGDVTYYLVYRELYI
jgi:hypothetical protein